MKRDNEQKEVVLSGQAVKNPEKPLVKASDELDDAELDGMAGGTLNFASPSPTTTTETVRLPIGGIGSFHPGAWST